MIVLSIKKVLGVELTTKGIAALEPGDQQDLWKLSRRIYSERVPREHQARLAAQRDQEKAEAKDFAAHVENLELDTSRLTVEQRERATRNNTLLAEYTRAEARRPTAEQVRAILNNKDAGATLDDLRGTIPTAPEPSSSGPSAIETFASLSDLKAAEIGRLETLVELAAGKPGLFAERRKEAKMKKDMKVALDKLCSLPPRRRKGLSPGDVVLPSAVFADVIDGVLWAPDLAVLCLCLGAIESRKAWGNHRVESDGDELVLVGEFHGWVENIDPRTQLRAAESLEHLNRSKWLSVEKAQVETGRELLIGGKQVVRGHRIRLGPRMLKALEKRADVS